MYGVEITKREVLVSSVILCAMLTVGLFINSSISEHTAAKNEVLISAVQIDSPSTFAHALKTNVGNVLAYGTLEAVDPVSFPELSGRFLAANKIREEYTMHVETYTVTDSEGNSHVETRTYWSWDYSGQATEQASTVTFLGHSTSPDSFIMNNMSRLSLSQDELSSDCPYRLRGNYLYKDSDTRYYYKVIPVSTVGTVQATLMDNQFASQATFYPNQQPDDVIENSLRFQNVPNIIFWVFWSLLIAGAIVGFCYLDNRWLEK